MTAKSDISAELIDDELVSYIASRHHLTPESLIRQFREGGNDSDLKLEDNEVAILTDMGLKQSAKGRNKPNT